MNPSQIEPKITGRQVKAIIWNLETGERWSQTFTDYGHINEWLTSEWGTDCEVVSTYTVNEFGQ